MSSSSAAVLPDQAIGCVRDLLKVGLRDVSNETTAKKWLQGLDATLLGLKDAIPSHLVPDFTAEAAAVRQAYAPWHERKWYREAAERHRCLRHDSYRGHEAEVDPDMETCLAQLRAIGAARLRDSRAAGPASGPVEDVSPTRQLPVTSNIEPDVSNNKGKGKVKPKGRTSARIDSEGRRIPKPKRNGKHPPLERATKSEHVVWRILRVADMCSYCNRSCSAYVCLSVNGERCKRCVKDRQGCEGYNLKAHDLKGQAPVDPEVAVAQKDTGSKTSGRKRKLGNSNSVTDSSEDNGDDDSEEDVDAKGEADEGDSDEGRGEKNFAASPAKRPRIVTEGTVIKPSVSVIVPRRPPPSSSRPTVPSPEVEMEDVAPPAIVSSRNLAQRLPPLPDPDPLQVAIPSPSTAPRTIPPPPGVAAPRPTGLIPPARPSLSTIPGPTHEPSIPLALPAHATPTSQTRVPSAAPPPAPSVLPPYAVRREALRRRQDLSGFHFAAPAGMTGWPREHLAPDSLPLPTSNVYMLEALSAMRTELVHSSVPSSRTSTSK